MSVTLKFAEHLSGLFDEGLDAPHRKVAELLVRDGLAVAVAGVAEPGPTMVRALAASSGAAPASTMIGHAQRTSVAEAARANGVAMHVLDWEPMWNPANHSLSTTLPAVLAVCEAAARRQGPFRQIRLEVPGKKLLAALALGIEAQARLRIASGFMEPGEFKFHPPGHVGPIGAAVAVGLLLGLDPKRLAHAIGIAASRAGTIQANVGSMTKAMHCGEPAAAGIESALLARAGFTADADALGSPIGYGRAFFGDRFEPRELTRKRAALAIVAPGPAIKMFPSQYGTHFAITAALMAREEIADPGRGYRSVRLTVPVMPYINRPDPVTGLAGKFSFQYTAAAALLDGQVTPASFTDKRRFAPDMVRLLDRIEVKEDKRIEGRFDRMRVDIAVTPETGREVKASCDGPPGRWGRPLDPKRISVKHDACFADYAAGRRLAVISEALKAPGRLDGPALVELMDALAAPAAAPTRITARRARKVIAVRRSVRSRAAAKR